VHFFSSPFLTVPDTDFAVVLMQREQWNNKPSNQSNQSNEYRKAITEP
jgi:hypothetical protein